MYSISSSLCAKACDLAETKISKINRDTNVRWP